MRHDSFSARLLAGATGAGMLLAALVPALPASAGITVVRPAQSFVVPNVQGGCNAHGGVRVDPCVVTLTATNPGPYTVTIRHPGGNGTIVETDNCASQGIATVTPAGTDMYQVTAGPNQGHCTAHFKYYNSQGKKVGYAHLRIVNQI